MTTARTIIKKALQKIGALYKSEDPSADEANDGLDLLNGMLASWSNKSMLINARITEQFVLAGGKRDYTMGPNGDFNTVRPISMISGYVTSGEIDYNFEFISDEEYANIQYKGNQSPYPEFCNPTNSYPLSTLTFYPVPAAAFLITLITEKQLTSFSSLDSDVAMPPGWDQALIYNLAILLAPEYGQQADQITIQIAKESLDAIKLPIMKARNMNWPYDLGNTQNIFSGYFIRNTGNS